VVKEEGQPCLDDSKGIRESSQSVADETHSGTLGEKMKVATIGAQTSSLQQQQEEEEEEKPDGVSRWSDPAMGSQGIPCFDDIGRNKDGVIDREEWLQAAGAAEEAEEMDIMKERLRLQLAELTVRSSTSHSPGRNTAETAVSEAAVSEETAVSEAAVSEETAVSTGPTRKISRHGTSKEKAAASSGGFAARSEPILQHAAGPATTQVAHDEHEKSTAEKFLLNYDWASASQGANTAGGNKLSYAQGYAAARGSPERRHRVVGSVHQARHRWQESVEQQQQLQQNRRPHNEQIPAETRLISEPLEEQHALQTRDRITVTKSQVTESNSSSRHSISSRQSIDTKQQTWPQQASFWMNYLAELPDTSSMSTSKPEIHSQSTGH